MLARLVMAAALAAGAQDPAPAVDASLRAAVERFFATQEAEDVDGYLALWSRKAQRPTRAQLQYVFDTGDDKFSEITIQRVAPLADLTRVRVAVIRSRTNQMMKGPDGAPRTFNMRYNTSLTFVREEEEWKLLREGAPADDLADAVVGAKDEREWRALLDAEADLLDERLLEAMSRRADAEARQGRYPAAQQIYERVLEIARRMGSRKGEGQALQNIANALYFQRQFARALETYEQRPALEREAANDDGIAAALAGIGTVRYAQFEYTAALANYREALAIQERLDDAMAIASTLISTGNVLYVQGDYEAAIADYGRSRQYYRRLAYTGGEARALEGLGLAYAANGDFASALEAYGGVLEEGRARRNAHGEASALFSIGEIHFRLGNLETARPLFDRSRVLFETVKDLPNAGRSWQGIAITDLISARFAGAEQAYRKSEEACAADDDKECVARAVVGLAFAQASQERFDDAITTYYKAIELFVSLKKVEEAARADVGLSRALAGKTDYEGALRAARRAQERAEPGGYDDVLWRALVAEARAHRRLDGKEGAMRAARGAVAIVERINRHALERPGFRVASDTTGAFALLALLQAEAGETTAALDTAEQLRVHALRLSLAANERDIYRTMTAEEREEERRLAIELASLHVQRDREHELPKPDAARLRRLDTSIREATDKRAAQQQQLFEKHPALRTWRALMPARTHREIPLRRGEVVLQFVIDDEELLVLTASDTGEGPAFAAHPVSIARQKLAERIAQTIDARSLRDTIAWRRAAADLIALLPDPILAQLQSASLVTILPDDVLWRVPFEALPIGDGYLADRTTVAYAASVASIASESAATDAARPEQTPAGMELLAVGAPVLAEQMRERLKATTPGWVLRASDAAEREVKRAASVYGESSTVVQTGAAATERAFRSEAERAGVLHLAVPFRMNSASPLFSPLLFAPSTPSPAAARDPAAAPVPEVRPPADNSKGAQEHVARQAQDRALRQAQDRALRQAQDRALRQAQDRADDGALEAREIVNATLRARAAVLSDGAATSMRNAAAAMATLKWVWLAAGVPALVMPRWTSDDAASEALLAELHARLKNGERAADALRAAAAAIRARPETSAPFFWSGWISIESRITHR